MRQTTANAWGQLVMRTSGFAWVDLNAKQVAATIDNSRVVVEAEPQGNFVLLMSITSSLELYKCTGFNKAMFISTLAKMPTASIPQMPQMPWVMNVQHGSSKFGLLSKN